MRRRTLWLCLVGVAVVTVAAVFGVFALRTGDDEPGYTNDMAAAVRAFQDSGELLRDIDRDDAARAIRAGCAAAVGDPAGILRDSGDILGEYAGVDFEANVESGKTDQNRAALLALVDGAMEHCPERLQFDE